MIKKFEFPDIRQLNDGRFRLKLSEMDFFLFLYIGAEILMSGGFSVEQIEEYIYKKRSSGYLERSGIYILLNSERKSDIERPLTRKYFRQLSESFPHVAEKTKNF